MNRLLCLAVACQLASAEPTMRLIEPLGIPIKAVVFGNSHAVLAPSPGGRDGMFYIPFYSTTGSALIGYHAESGERVEAKLGSSGGYGCCVGTDGALYIGGVNPGNLYRYEPKTGDLRNLGGAETGATYIWATAASAAGRIYGACYPTCNVIEYDIQTGLLRDLGRLHPSEAYCRSICVDHRGLVWAGVGTHAHLIVLDPQTGVRREVLPEAYRTASSAYDLAVNGAYVTCALVDGAKEVLIFDAATETLKASVPVPAGSIWWMNCEGAPTGHAYLYSLPDGDLYDYDIEKAHLGLLAPRLGQCERVVAGRFVHGINDQDYFLYDLEEKRFLKRELLTRAGDGMAVQTLASGRDGNIYGSTYINQHMFRYEVSSETLADLGKVIRVGGQVDSMHGGRDGRIYMGAYVLAHLAVYDPARPWRPGLEPDANPRELGALGHGQYRTQAILLGPDHNLWVGSIPSYNSGPTGAFSRWNLTTGECTAWTDLVPGGGVSRLAADEQFIYGLGGGVFFAWDPITAKKVYEEKRPAGALAVAPGGEVVISAGDRVVLFDARTRTVTATVPSPVGQMSALLTAPDGKLYGITPKALAEIDPATWSVRSISDGGGSFLAVDRTNTLYFARGSGLFRARP